MRVLLFLFSICFCLTSMATLEIPQRMNSTDRKKALEILGFSSATKILGNPYPLGGYSGFEIGYTTELLPTGDLASLGSKTNRQSETSVSSLTLGKGIYNNIDLYLHFTPGTQAEAISNIGGQFRWGFYQADYLPAHLSLISSVNSLNFQNRMTTMSQSNDLVVGFSVNDLTLYTGLGLVRSIGTFYGGDSAITDTGEVAQEDLSQAHYLAGLNVRLQKMFLALQIDRYTQATYSAKLGVRF